MDQSRKVAKLARGQLNREIKFSCSCIRGEYIALYMYCCLHLFVYQVYIYIYTSGTCASVAEGAREFTEAILGAAHAALPEARRIPRRLGWCERPVVRAALLAALGKKREARRQCKVKHTTATWKALRPACKEVRAAIGKGIEIHLEEYMAELETLLRHRDMRGLHKHLKRTVGLGGRKTEGQQAIKDENGNLLRDKGDILQRWERFFGNLLNTKSPALQPSIVEKVQRRRKAPPPPPGARS